MRSLVWLSLLVSHLSLVSSQDSEEEQYETHYACEDSRLNISCSSGLHLNIIRANYGRFSIAICNAHGNTEWSVNCMSPRTLRVIRARCQGGSECQVPVDSTIFGDPCPGTFKYIEVHYSCDHEVNPSTTGRPRPPWFPESPPHSWPGQTLEPAETNQTLASHRQTEETDPSGQQTIEEESDNDTEDQEDETTEDEEEPRVIKVKVPKPLNPLVEDRSVSRNAQDLSGPGPNIQAEVTHTDDSDIQGDLIPDSSPEFVTIANFTQYCAPVTARGLFWNWTRSGDTAVLQCPADSTGFAKWRCAGDPVDWASISPSLAECQSKWLNNLDSRLRDGESIATVSSDLAQMSGLQQMYGGDLQLSSRMLKHMAERMHFDIQSVARPGQKEAMVTELVQNVVLTASNILDKINHMSWADLSHDDVAAAATSLMVGLEENAFLLADSVTTEKIIIKPTNNILLSIRVMQARNTQSQRFPTVENLEMWDNQEDSIELASSSLLRNSENGAVRIIFATYNEFDQLLVPSQRPNATLRFVNSKVISASIGKGRHLKLQEPVKITLKHLRTVNVSRPVCVYWDYSSQTWSNGGCRLITSNTTHTQCQCDHLTNFALIMEDGPAEVTSSLTSLSSQVTTIIACVATLVCVTLMLAALVMTWRKFRVAHQCRSMLQKSGIPCFHKTKELSEKDKKQGNFYTVTPKLNGSVNNNTGKPEANIEMDNQQYFEHMIAMQKNQENLVLNKTMSRRNTLNNSETQETNLSEVDLSKPSTVSNLNINNTNNPNNKKNFKAKTQCQHVLPNNFQLGLNPENAAGVNVYPKKSNAARAMSPFNHIYMEIDPKTEEGALYEAVSQSEAGRNETYMLSSVSDMSDDDFRRCSDISRQSSSRYAENKPLIRTSQINSGERNLLTTISSVMQSQSVRVAPQPQRTSILSTISGLRYTDLGQPGLPSLPPITASHELTSQASVPQMTQEAPVQVTTNVDGDQFVCLNLNNPGADQQTFVTAAGQTYVTGPELTGQYQAECLAPGPQFMTSASNTLRQAPGPQLVNFGTIQAPVHSQLVIQRVGTLPRQYAHPLAQL